MTDISLGVSSNYEERSWADTEEGGGGGHEMAAGEGHGPPS